MHIQSQRRVGKPLKLKMYANTDLILKYDSKINFKNLCREGGVPVVDDVILVGKHIYSDSELVEKYEKILEFKKKTGTLIIKGEYGVSGSKTNVINEFDFSTMKEFLKNCNKDERLIVGTLNKRSSSTSSIWFITTNEDCKLVKTSNQLLTNDIVYCGNEFPEPFNDKVVTSLTFEITKRLAEEK